MRALVRRPSPRLQEGLVTHLEASVVDVDRARRQWSDYVVALEQHGWEIVEVPEAPDAPDGVFIEDAILMYEDLAIVTRPGAASRALEPSSVEPVVRNFGYEVHEITAPATLEGGDVLKVGSTVYVGLSARTNLAGIEQLSGILATRGATVVGVPLTKALHLKSAVTALPDGTVIGWSDVVDDPSMFETFEAMPEEAGADVVILDDTHLLMSSSAPRTAELLAERGYEPVIVDISEFEKLEGCVTCLSVRLRHSVAP